jgi:hypothetical protein
MVMIDNVEIKVLLLNSEDVGDIYIEGKIFVTVPNRILAMLEKNPKRNNRGCGMFSEHGTKFEKHPEIDTLTFMKNLCLACEEDKSNQEFFEKCNLDAEISKEIDRITNEKKKEILKYLKEIV